MSSRVYIAKIMLVSTLSFSKKNLSNPSRKSFAIVTFQTILKAFGTLCSMTLRLKKFIRFQFCISFLSSRKLMCRSSLNARSKSIMSMKVMTLFLYA